MNRLIRKLHSLQTPSEYVAQPKRGRVILWVGAQTLSFRIVGEKDFDLAHKMRRWLEGEGDELWKGSKSVLRRSAVNYMNIEEV